jgi:hypothetical protein
MMLDESLAPPADHSAVLGRQFRSVITGVAVGEAGPDVRRIFTVEDLDEVLDCSVLRYPYVQVLRNGEQASLDSYTTPRRVGGTTQQFYLDGAKLAEQFAAGHTIVLNALEEWHRPARDLARRLAAVVRARVQVTAFCTPPGNTGFAMHRDDVDVFAVQTEGSKCWRLASPPEADGFEPGHVAGPPADVIHELVTERGMVLWMHRGVLHSATAADQLSIHVSLTIRRPTVASAIESRLRPRLTELSLHHLDPDPERASQQLAQALAEMARLLQDTDPAEAAARAEAANSAVTLAPAPRSVTAVPPA